MAETEPPADAAAMTVEADESYAKGVAAIKAGNMDDAIELLARALELKVTVHGEQAIECAAAYYRYGCALFYKAQDENTVFGKQAQAQADAKDDAKRKAEAADEGEACDDDEDEADGDGEAKNDDGDDENGEEEEDDMELAWKLVENARLIYEEDETHPIELANCFETLGEMNTEHANFQSALEDLEQCLAILEVELDEDDRRIAGVLLSISVAQQMDDKLEKALKNCTRAVGICEARIKRLKTSDEAAVAAVNASLPPGAPAHADPLAAAKAELEQIEAVLGDLKVREEELQGLVSEDNDTREQIKKAARRHRGRRRRLGAPRGLRGRRSCRDHGVRRAEAHDRFRRGERAREPRRRRQERRRRDARHARARRRRGAEEGARARDRRAHRRASRGRGLVRRRGGGGVRVHVRRAPGPGAGGEEGEDRADARRGGAGRRRDGRGPGKGKRPRRVRAAVRLD